jgi:hypothetical protein
MPIGTVKWLFACLLTCLDSFAEHFYSAARMNGNESSYVIHPDSIGMADLCEAIERAQGLADGDGQPRQIEDCGDKTVVARIRPRPSEL